MIPSLAIEYCKLIHLWKVLFGLNDLSYLFLLHDSKSMCFHRSNALPDYVHLLKSCSIQIWPLLWLLHLEMVIRSFELSIELNLEHFLASVLVIVVCNMFLNELNLLKGKENTYALFVLTTPSIVACKSFFFLMLTKCLFNVNELTWCINVEVQIHSRGYT